MFIVNNYFITYFVKKKIVSTKNTILHILHHELSLLTYAFINDMDCYFT